jgi:hypothetical protein
MRKVLAKPKYCSCCLLSQPLTKIEKEPWTAVQFIFMVVVSFLVLVLEIFPVVNSIWWISALSFTMLLSLIFWAKSTFTDPGYLMKSPKLEFLTLVERFDSSCVCPKC